MIEGRRLRSFALCSLLGHLAMGCSSSAPPTEVPTVAPPKAPQVAVDAPAPSGPVDAPKNLVMVLRAFRPAATLDSIDRVLALPISLRSMVEAKSEGATKHLELEAPFDLAIALDPSGELDDEPKFFFGASIPLRSVDDGVALFQSLDADVRATAAGHYRVQDDDLYCELLPTGGRAPARAVCSNEAEGLRELGPWLGRTLPLEPTQPLDLHARFDLGPWRARYLPELRGKADEGLAELRQELSSQLSVVDPELLEAPGVVLEESLRFAEDLDAFQMSMSYARDRGELVFAGELAFRQSTGWVTRVMTDGNQLRSAPPDAFWRLPKSADSAMWGRSSDPAHFLGIRRVARKSLAQGLAFVPQLPEPDRQAILGLFDAIPTMRGVWASASGTLPALPGGAPKDHPEKTTPAQVVVEAKNLARAALPWSIVSTEGDAAEMVRFLERGVDVYDRAVKLVKKDADERVKNADPDFKKYAVEQRKDLDRAPKLKIVRNPAGLPKGSVALDVDIAFTSKDVWELGHPIKDWEKRVEHPKGPEARGNLVFRVLVVPEARGRYLWGYSVDPKALDAAALSALEGKSPDGTIATRADLARLRTPAVGGGFVSYARLAEQLKSLGEDDRDLRELVELFEKLPHKGASPVFVVLDGAAGATPRLRLEMTLEKPWIEDIGAAAREVVAKELGLGTR